MLVLFSNLVAILFAEWKVAGTHLMPSGWAWWFSARPFCC